MKRGLLLIDIQNDYFKNGKMELVGPEKAGENIARILKKFRKEQLPVFHIRHEALAPTATFFIPGTRGAEIHECAKPLNNEKIIVKNFPNSFLKTDLFKTLQESQITDLVICGMMTHMCLDATVRAAKDLGYSCTVIGDGCATKDLEIFEERVKASEVHTAFLAALSGTYAKIVMTDEFLATD
ncbi:MAG: cysteine hydrolase [Bacteroidales bacterium]|nr:cysteine hydrolase [Bacteroidales bacterium]